MSKFIIHDQHIHTEYSEDSSEKLLEYYLKAKSLGCSYFVTTEHIDMNVNDKGKDWLVDFNSLIEEEKQIESPDGPKMLLGVELGYRREYLDDIMSVLNSQNFDIVNLSIHDSGIVEYYYQEGFIQYGVRNSLKMYYNQMKDAVNKMKNYDVLSHIDYGYKTAYSIDPTIKFTEEIDIIREILSIVIKDGKCLEINTKVQRAFPDEHLKELLAIYKELGGHKISLSSDAHTLDRYYDGFEHYIDIIIDAGFDSLCYYIGRKEHQLKIKEMENE